MAERLDARIPEARTASYFFRGQAIHLLFLALFLPAAHALAAPAFGGEPASWAGLRDRTWFWLSIGAAVLMQVIVWLGWRAQLGWGLFTRLFGRLDLVIWGTLFLPFLVARPILIFGAAMADRGSLALRPWVALTLSALALAPALYAMVSVARHFGVPRALGGDHFRLAYRGLPPVRQAAFGWTPNAMYVLVFLLLWSIALALRSHVALVAVVFQHGYIWVHYLGTEKPDMDLMYGTGSAHG